jgi:hypothetical protein
MLMVVAVHSAMAYVATNPALQPRYDPPPLISDAIARLPSISSVHPNTSI